MEYIRIHVGSSKMIFFAVDHTRVILKDVDAGNTDYINANRIVQDEEQHFVHKKEYIATQGCMQ